VFKKFDNFNFQYINICANGPCIGVLNNICNSMFQPGTTNQQPIYIKTSVGSVLNESLCLPN